MHGPAANFPVSQQWMLIGIYVMAGSSVFSVLVIAFLVVDRWFVRVRGLPGTARIAEMELVQTLPRRVWEVRLEVTPEDSFTASFRRRARWSEADFWSQTHELLTGMELMVRFRRAPRPLVLPAKLR